MKKLFFCISFLISTGIYGQQHYRFGHVNSDHGLSNLDVLSIYEDSRGYLWIGTLDGLNKFNGTDVKIYKPDRDNSNSICHQGVKSIVEDKNGNLWFGTRHGLSLYKPKEDRFYNFKKVGDCENCLAGRVITTMLLDEEQIWLGTNAGLSVIDINLHEIRSWWHDENTDVVELLFAIRHIIKTDDDRLLMASDEGLIIYDPGLDKFTYFDTDDGLRTTGLGNVFHDSNGRYWLASDRDGIYHIEGDLDHPTFILHPELFPENSTNKTVYTFAERENGELWIGTHHGLTILDQKNDNITFHSQEVDNPNTLSQNVVRKLHIGSQGRIWLGTPSGVDVFDPYMNQFELLTHKKDNVNSISGTSVKANFEDSQGFIWLGSLDAGISIIEKKKGGGEKYYHIQKGSGSNNLLGNEVYAFEEDEKGRIWVSIPQGLHIIDWPDRSRFEYEIEVVELGRIEDNKLPSPYIYQIYKDEQNTKWIGTHGEGLISLDAEGQYRQYKYVNQDPQYASVDYIINVAEDREGRIWLGNFNLCGGVLQDPITEDSYRRIQGDSALYGKNINDYFFTESGVMISTNEGVFYYEDRNELLTTKAAKFDYYTEAEGLSADFANVLIPQSEDVVWVSTTNGISKIDLSSHQVSSFKNILSAGDRNFNHNAGMMTSDSMIYFGGSSGVLRFNPYQIVRNEELPRVYFKNFKILNKDVPVDAEGKAKHGSIPVETSFLDKIQLRHSDRLFSVEMEVINYRQGLGTKLEYILEGFDNEWQEADNYLIARSNLAPGTYTLRARASNTDGIWGEEAVMQIHVTGPWWKSSWAFLLYGLLLIGIFRLWVQMKLNREREIVQIKNAEREKFRTESSKDFHDEAGTKITRISLLTEILKKKIGSNNEAGDILSKIDKNLKELNLGMRDFLWSLKLENDNLLETILRFTEFAHMFCEEANIQFKTQFVEDELKEVKLEIKQRRHILLILKEGLNNSVKHGSPSVIELKCSFESNTIMIELSDDGVGYDQETEVRGNGLGNIKFRAKEIGAALELNSEIGEGSSIKLELNGAEI